MRSGRPAILLTAFFLASSGAEDSAELSAARQTNTTNDDLMRSIEEHVVTGAVEALWNVQRAIKERIEFAEDSGTAVATADRYALGYVDWRLSRLLDGKSGKQRKRLLSEAQTELDRILRESSSDAEAHALRGTVIGERISGALGGMLLGPKASASLARAIEHGLENPRVALQRGISFYYTPEAFGGGMEKAEAELRRARELFRQVRGRDRWPHWGQIDVLGWLGQVLVDKGETAAARELYEEALGLEPNHAWIRDELLPAIAGD